MTAGSRPAQQQSGICRKIAVPTCARKSPRAVRLPMINTQKFSIQADGLVATRRVLRRKRFLKQAPFIGNVAGDTELARLRDILAGIVLLKRLQPAAQFFLADFWRVGWRQGGE